MLKKEKPMMTVAAIIEQAQSRWMDQHPLQVYNRAFQGSYCKYYCIFCVCLLWSFPSIFTSSPLASPQLRLHLWEESSRNSSDLYTAREWERDWICVIQLCAHDNIRKESTYTCEATVHVWWPQFQNSYEKGNFLCFFLFSKLRAITSANKISIESQFVRCAGTTSAWGELWLGVGGGRLFKILGVYWTPSRWGDGWRKTIFLFISLSLSNNSSNSAER